MKYVIILNSKGDELIIAEYNELLTAFKHFEAINAGFERTDPESDKYFELAKYDENNKCSDWDDEELESIGQPAGQFITKQI